MRFTPQEKPPFVAEYIRNQSVTKTQCWVHTLMRKEPPARNTIIQWRTLSMESANISHRGQWKTPYSTRDQTVK